MSQEHVFVAASTASTDIRHPVAGGGFPPGVDPPVPDAAGPGDAPGEERLRVVAEADDRDEQVGAASALAIAMRKLSGLERTELVASWASSTSPRLRLAIARALRHAPPSAADLVAIDHLAADPDPDVRLAIAETAWLRGSTAPAHFGAILEQLMRDSDLTVRTMARLMLETPVPACARAAQRRRASMRVHG